MRIPVLQRVTRVAETCDANAGFANRRAFKRVRGGKVRFHTLCARARVQRSAAREIPARTKGSWEAVALSQNVFNLFDVLVDGSIKVVLFV